VEDGVVLFQSGASIVKVENNFTENDYLII